MSTKDLDDRLPYSTIVRFPQYQSLEETDEAYHQNCIDFDDFLNQCFTEPGSMSGIMFKEALESFDGFKAWMLESHRIMCQGNDGDSIYDGMSRVGGDDYVAQFRDLNNHGWICCKLSKDFLLNLFEVAKFYDDPFARGLDDFDDWNQVRLDVGIKEIIRTEEVPEPDLSSLKDVYWYGPYDGGYLFVYNTPQLSVPMIYSAPGSKCALYYFPGHEYIDDYLAVMHKSFREAVAADEPLRHLARFYQYGIRSQAVPRVWNSLLMGFLNNVAERAGYGRQSHHEFDLISFCLEAENYEQFIEDIYTGRKGINDINS